MAFIRKIRKYYYLVENKRVGKKVYQKTVAYLGKTKGQIKEKMNKFNKTVTEQNEKTEYVEDRAKHLKLLGLSDTQINEFMKSNMK